MTKSLYQSETARGAVELIRLSGPVILARAGMVFMLFADTLMVGRYDSEQLAYLAISLTIVQPLFVFGLGLIMGTQVITSIAYGAGRLHDCGLAWRRGAPYGFCIGLVFLVIALFGEQGLRLTGQSQDLVVHGGAVVAISGYSLPFALLFIASASFLEGIKRPMPGVIFLIIANLANIALNWIMIYGNLGAPAMGATGAVWATNICRFFLAVSIVAYIWWMRDGEAFGVRKQSKGGWRSWKKQREIGYATGLTVGVESIAFNGLGVLAGWMGALAIGAHAIVMNLLVLIAMVSIGIGSATGIQVGFATGQNDIHAVRRSGWTGFCLVIVVVGSIAVLLMVFPQWFASLYTSDLDLMGVVVPAIFMLGLVVVFDGMQLVMSSALRGRGETWIISAMNILAFIIIMVPISWWLSIGLNHGIIGLYEAVFLSCIVATLIFSLYFYVLTIQDRRKIFRVNQKA